MINYGLVSVVTPTWNCGRFIAETIESVLAQSYPNWEMLIVDDCSNDDTRKIVEQYQQKDSRIKYHCLDCNSGAAVARNFALKMARGRWIAFLDSDDLWKPEKLERQLAFMVKNNYAFTYHNYTEIDEQSKPLGVFVSGIRKVSKFGMFACCWPGCLSVIYDAERIGLIQIENVKKNNDTAMWLKVVEKAPCYLLDEDLALYRRRANSITPKPLWQRIWAHYPLFRVAERMNPVAATFWVGMNVFGNAFKKIFYVKEISN
ncbi:MAG: glycosyltransferase family 2 protein [Muribaculum sp.]|nr:glycosyltransferase family 2 protein [Muribaculaceae bacterium]MCM1081312.1 glycosyltransferase family 2 protein [Muribaculum sp.]